MTYKIDMSGPALDRILTVVVAAIQVKQPGISRTDILKNLDEVPLDVLLQVQEDIARIKSGETQII